MFPRGCKKARSLSNVYTLTLQQTLQVLRQRTVSIYHKEEYILSAYGSMCFLKHS